MHPAVFFSIDLVPGCLGQVVYESKTYRASFILSSGRTRLTLLRAALGYARKRFLLHSCQPLFQLVPLLSYFFCSPASHLRNRMEKSLLEMSPTPRHFHFPDPICYR